MARCLDLHGWRTAVKSVSHGGEIVAKRDAIRMRPQSRRATRAPSQNLRRPDRPTHGSGEGAAHARSRRRGHSDRRRETSARSFDHSPSGRRCRDRGSAHPSAPAIQNRTCHERAAYLSMASREPRQAPIVLDEAGDRRSDRAACGRRNSARVRRDRQQRQTRTVAAATRRLAGDGVPAMSRCPSEIVLALRRPHDRRHHVVVPAVAVVVAI